MAGLCIPSDVKVDVTSGLIKNCLLWSPADTAYADVYAINAAIKGKLPANGMLKAGHLGTLSVTDHTVNVGNPLIFTKANIGNYNF